MTIWRPSSLGIFSILPNSFTSSAIRSRRSAQILVSHLAATETQGDLHLVAVLEELVNRAHLDLVVMGVGPGTELHFLDLDDLLILASLGFFLLSLVLELAIVHDLADGRRRVRGNLHEIESGLFGHYQGSFGGYYAYVFAIGADEADFRGPNAFVDAGASITHRRCVVRSAGYGLGPFTVGNVGAN